MNQRKSRGNNSKNNLDFMSLNTGGLTARHTPNEDPQVQTPQKTTGESKPEVQHTAKASPNFKPITSPAKAMDKKTEAEIVKDNSTTVDAEDKKTE